MTSGLFPAPTASLLPAGVRRTLEAMRANLEHEWSIPAMAAVAGLSKRTLQQQFRAFLGKAPAAALRDLRFAQARRALLQASPATRIMDVALACGLAHIGRFSLEYRRRYGESPSQTLQRQGLLDGALARTPAFAPARGERPTLALGPLEADAGHGAVAAHLAEELAIALGRAGLAVVARPEAARYHLAGAIRGPAGRPRLILRLLEREGGRLLWAQHVDALPAAANVEQSAARIAAALQPPLRQAEIERAWRKPVAELNAQDLALRALPGVLAIDADGNARSLDLLEAAMERDPANALAAALAAWARAQRLAYHFSRNPLAERERSLALAHHSRTLAADATSLAVLGNALTLLHDVEGAGQVIRRALAADGGSAWAWSRSGWIEVYGGDAEAAIERFKIALDLAPQDALAFNSLVGIGCAHFKAGRYVEAARWQERALAEHPTAGWVHRTLCPAYVLAGDETQARRSLAALRKTYPALTLSEVQQGLPPVPPGYRALVVDALETVGLPA